MMGFWGNVYYVLMQKDKAGKRGTVLVGILWDCCYQLFELLWKFF